MRLLVITSHGDTLNSVRPEAEIFIGLATRGHDVTVMTGAGSPYESRMLDAGITVEHFVPSAKISPAAIRHIRRALRTGGYDAVYSFNNKAITNANFAAIGLPVCVITYRGQTGNIHRFDPSSYLTHLHPRVDRVLCVADAVRDSVRAQHRHPDRVVTVYKGHDLDWYQGKPASLAEFGVPRDAFVLGCVANNRPRKGVPVLLKAMRLLTAEKRIHLLLIGGGMDSVEIRKLIAATPWPERIHVAGHRSDAPALIAACHASVLPALKREGLPKTVIESMVARVTPVVTDTGGNAELVTDGVCGRVVPPGDPSALAAAIEWLHDNPTERALMGQRARERIQTHFNVKQSIIGTEAAIEAGIRDARRRHR
jgi:glycosyltransferase involved in cell wall biosynthesis